MGFSKLKTDFLTTIAPTEVIVFEPIERNTEEKKNKHKSRYRINSVMFSYCNAVPLTKPYLIVRHTSTSQLQKLALSSCIVLACPIVGVLDG